MQVNQKVRKDLVFNHEGVKARHIMPLQQLRRLVMATMLWEDTFYEGGSTAVAEIQQVLPLVPGRTCAALAVEARTKMNLRHVPMVIAYFMTLIETHKRYVGDLLPEILLRADEPAEFLALYWKLGGKSLSAQVKKGLRKAMLKFNEYSIAKYNRDKEVKLRDVVFLTHAKAGDDLAKGRLFANLVNKDHFPEQTKSASFPVRKHYKLKADGTPRLEVPRTWETELSARPTHMTEAEFKVHKKKVFEDLMLNNELGGLAFLRNLRNMEDVGVDRQIIREYMGVAKFERVLPFRFIAAARVVPQLEDVLEEGMFRALKDAEKMRGRTVLLIDTSPSMHARVSAKSDLTREDAAAALAVLLREVCESAEIYSFSSEVKQVPPRRGFALAEAIKTAVPSNGTLLGKAVRAVSGKYDRLVVFTDEESQDAVPSPDAGKISYMNNVANYRNGIGYGSWVYVDGFSEAVVDFIRMYETEGVVG